MPPSAPPSQRTSTHSSRRGVAAWVLAWVCVALGMSVARPAAAQTESVLLNFTANSGAAPGAIPWDNLIQASDGNFYGMTYWGGLNNASSCSSAGCGTVFKITPAGTFTLLHSFSSTTTDGSIPESGLIQGTDGNFYGTTPEGGSGTCSPFPGCGTVFKITSTGTFTLLHSFVGTDGMAPSSSLVQGTDGNFYGTTHDGGASTSGTVFKITPTGTLTLLHSFAGADGAQPLGGLVQGADGSFYGTTGGGGVYGGGTVFKITPTGTFTLLHSFSGSTTDGISPVDSLVQGADGSFYGTTTGGGANNCSAFNSGSCGTIFKITSTGAFTLLHSFAGAADGLLPQDSLVLGTDGIYYGTANGGGPNGYGTVFDISSTGTFTLLHSFPHTTTDGDAPEGGMVQGSDGTFYGTTTGGGTDNAGTIYKLTPATPLPGPVQLTVPFSVTAGAPFTLGYSTYNAYSATLKQCFATNNAGVTDWTGIYTSSPTATNVNLTAPTTVGTYTYALTCGGMESGFATLNVAPATTYNPTTVSVSAVTAPFGSTAGVTVTATEAGPDGPVTGGVVTFSLFFLGTGSFNPATCTLSAAGTCTTTYIPTGTTPANIYANDIQASFAANNAYNPATASNTLTITPAATPPLTVPVNSTSGVQIAALTFTAPGTLGAINVLTLGAPNLDFQDATPGGMTNQNPCGVGTAYAAGDTCNVFYVFTPLHPGPRYGGVTLISTTGALLASSYISGIGTGPQVTWTPGTQTTLISGYYEPWGIAIDGSGDIFFSLNGQSTSTSGTVFEALAAGGYTTVIRLAPNFTFSENHGLAIDGLGNLYLSDYGFSQIEQIVAAGGYTTVNILGHGFVQPDGVAVDGAGNVFVGDTGNNAVKEMTAASGYTTINTLGSGFTGPMGVAVDANDNVFVDDVGHDQIKEILAAGGYTTVNTLAAANGNFKVPYNIALDASGDVFVADTENNAVKEILAAGGYTTVNTLLSGFTLPLGIATDGSGDVYVSNTAVAGKIVKLDYSDPPTLNFAATPVGQTSTDSPQAVTMTNDGNEPLIFTVPASGPNPTITPGFTVGSASTCPQLTSSSSAGTLAAGASCNYSVSFTPIATGLDSGFLVPTDNNLNIVNATQTVPLNGTGVAAAPTVLSITPHSGPTTGGTTVTITGTSFTGTTAVRFGAVAAASFAVNSATQITAVSPAEPAGTVDVTVTTPNGTTATSPADLFTFIPPPPPAVITLTGTPNPVFLLNPVTFTATVTASSYTPTGSVTFLDGTTPLNTVGLSGGVATLTTSTLSMGLHNITAVYNGPSLPPQTSAVLPELVEDFSLTITNPNVVIPHGGTGVFNLIVTTVGGALTASTISFGIAGSPDHSPTTFSPASVAVGSGTTNVTLTIQTPDYPVGPWSSIARPPVVLALTAFGALLLPLGRRRRRASRLVQRLLLFVVLASFAALSGCGSGWKTQNYSITVTASAGPLSHSASATLTSKQ